MFSTEVSATQSISWESCLIFHVGSISGQTAGTKPNGVMKTWTQSPLQSSGKMHRPWAAFPGELLELRLPEPSCLSEFQVLAGGPFPQCQWMRLEDASKYAPSLCGPLRPRPSHIVPWWAGQTAVAGEPFIAEPWGLQAEGRTQYSTYFLARSTKISRRQDSRYSVPWSTPSEHCLPGSPVSIKWLPSPDHWVGSHSHKLSYTGTAPSLLCCP